MITNLNDWRKTNEYFTAPGKYKYHLPEQVTYDKLLELISDMFGEIPEDKTITMEDLRSVLTKYINNMQLDNEWLNKFKTMLIDNGWTCIGTCNTL